MPVPVKTRSNEEGGTKSESRRDKEEESQESGLWKGSPQQTGCPADGQPNEASVGLEENEVEEWNDCVVSRPFVMTVIIINENRRGVCQCERMGSLLYLYPIV